MTFKRFAKVFEMKLKPTEREKKRWRFVLQYQEWTGKKHFAVFLMPFFQHLTNICENTKCKRRKKTNKVSVWFFSALNPLVVVSTKRKKTSLVSHHIFPPPNGNSFENMFYRIYKLCLIRLVQIAISSNTIERNRKQTYVLFYNWSANINELCTKCTTAHVVIWTNRPTNHTAN